MSFHLSLGELPSSYSIKLLCLVAVLVFDTYTLPVQSTDMRFSWFDCELDYYNLYSEDSVYFLSWDGEDYIKRCTLNFKLKQYGLSNFRVCAKATVFTLSDCKGPELVFAKVYGREMKSYNCYDELPIEEYCDDSYIQVKLRPSGGSVLEDNDGSKLRITVYAKKIESSNSNDNIGDPTFITIVITVAVTVLLTVVIVTGFVCCGWRAGLSSCYKSLFGSKGFNGEVIQTGRHEEHNMVELAPSPCVSSNQGETRPLC